MLKAVLKWLKSFTEAWKGILAVAGAIIVISTVSISIDHWKNKNVVEAIADSTIKETQKTQGVKIDSVLYYIHGIKVEMGVMKEGMTDFNSTQQNLVNAVGNHMAKSSEVTKDDLYNFMKEFQLELKKNSYGYEGSSSLLTPFDRRE